MPIENSGSEYNQFSSRKEAKKIFVLPNFWHITRFRAQLLQFTFAVCIRAKAVKEKQLGRDYFGLIFRSF